MKEETDVDLKNPGKHDITCSRYTMPAGEFVVLFKTTSTK